MPIKIIDYSHSNYIPIFDGDIIIWEDYGYLRHMVNLTMYDGMIKETEELSDIFPQSHMKKILIADINHIKTLLSTLRTHHRQARSLNFLGSALKVIAGTPDFEDFEKAKFKQEQLIESNNRQIDINTKINEQLRILTDTVNTIIKSEHDKRKINTEHLYETLLARNRISIITLENLILSISLAKLNIVDPAVLDSNEIHSIVTNSSSTDTSVSEIISLASIKVLQNLDLISFIIRFPKPISRCKKISVFPVPHQQKILSFGNYNILAKCESQVFSVTKCNRAVLSTFCNINNITTCAQQLVSGNTAQCTTEFDTLNKLVVVDDGVIIINNDFAEVIEKDSTHKINGTYLLIFDDEINVNGTKFININSFTGRNPGEPNFLNINITEHKEIISLPYLHTINMENLRHIDELKTKIIVHPIITIIVTVTSLLIAFLAIRLVQQFKRKKHMQNVLKSIEEIVRKTEDGLHSKKGIVNDS